MGKNNIESLRDERDWSMDQLADRCVPVTTASQINKLEKGQRKLTLEWARKLAKAFGVPVSKVAPEFSDVTESQGADLEGVAVIGEVQAGVWKEALQWEPEEQFSLPIAKTGPYKTAYALKVMGDSMDEHYQEGDFVIVIPLDDYQHRLENGDHVIVERRRRDGISEATIKELVIEDGAASLWCRSSNPKFKKGPINIHWPYLDGQIHDTETIEIKGVVDSLHRKRKR